MNCKIVYSGPKAINRKRSGCSADSAGMLPKVDLVFGLSLLGCIIALSIIAPLYHCSTVLQPFHPLSDENGITAAFVFLQSQFILESFSN